MEMFVNLLSIGFLVCSVIAASRHQHSLQVHLRSEGFNMIHSGLLPVIIGDYFSLSLFLVRGHGFRIIFFT